MVSLKEICFSGTWFGLSQWQMAKGQCIIYQHTLDLALRRFGYFHDHYHLKNESGRYIPENAEVMDGFGEYHTELGEREG